MFPAGRSIAPAFFVCCVSGPVRPRERQGPFDAVLYVTPARPPEVTAISKDVVLNSSYISFIGVRWKKLIAREKFFEILSPVRSFRKAPLTENAKCGKILLSCGYDGIGRHARFRFSCATRVGVRVPIPAPYQGTNFDTKIASRFGGLFLYLCRKSLILWDFQHFSLFLEKSSKRGQALFSCHSNRGRQISRSLEHPLSGPCGNEVQKANTNHL